MHDSINSFSASEPKVPRLPYTFIAVQGKADQWGNLPCFDSVQYFLGLRYCWGTDLEEENLFQSCPYHLLEMIPYGCCPPKLSWAFSWWLPVGMGQNSDNNYDNQLDGPLWIQYSSLFLGCLLFSSIYLAWCLGQPPRTFLTMQTEIPQKYLAVVAIFSHLFSRISCVISRWQGTHCHLYEFGYQGSWKVWERVAEPSPIMPGRCLVLQRKRAFCFALTLEHRLNSKIK